tara:strand:+ start:213 stop:386 length:174 start_codon:yes stop_codon:yes gene_type:complete
MTYRELIEQLENLTKEQLDCIVTVEDAYENECRAAELRICGDNHDSLDDNHPVIFVP